MTSSASKRGPKRRPSPAKGGRQTAVPAARAPEWADGLRQLYDSVVSEPLPDSFKDLLYQLDKQK